MSKSKAFSVEVPDQNTRYVAINSVKDCKVIAHGRSAGVVAKKARKDSDDKPVILYVPNLDETYIY